MYSQTATAASSNNGQNNWDQNNEKIVEPPAMYDKSHTYVVQKYVKQPALWNGHKFDFRIYVLLTSVIDPMTVFLYKDGLVRLASEKYKHASKNVNDPYIHLTNYSLNKKNKNFDNDLHKLKLSNCLSG